MNVKTLVPGDTVYAARDLLNDGSVPELAENEIIAKMGTRGVLINIGHLEEQPNVALYLVRFETEALNLGPPIGCWEEEISGSELNTN